jgi:purine-binding chemotaxis protein CheW
LVNRTLLFRVGGTLYGCDIGEAQELIPTRAATRIPGAPVHVRGLINVRGAIVTVLDLGRRLDPAAAPNPEGFTILVPYDGRLVGIAVDEVLDVRVLAEDPAPGTAVEGGLVRGIGRVDDSSVIVLDLTLLVQQSLLS